MAISDALGQLVLLLVGWCVAPLLIVDVIVKWVSGPTPPSRPPVEPPAPSRLSHWSLGAWKQAAFGGCTLRYLERGAQPGAKKPLVVALHGFPESPYSYRYLLQAFSPTHTVVAVELPGYGLSMPRKGTGLPPPALSPERVIYILRALVVALAAEHNAASVVLVGHDWGGMLAWVLASSFPHLFSHLVILNMPHPLCLSKNRSLAQLRKSWYIAAFQPPLLPEFYLRSSDYAFLRAALVGKRGGVVNQERWMDEEDVEAIGWTMRMPGALTGALSYYRQVLAYVELLRAARAALPNRKLPMPVLQLHGADDAFLGAEQCAGAEQLAQSLTLKVIPHASHWVQQDAVLEVVDAIAAFLGVTPTQPLPLRELPAQPPAVGGRGGVA